LGGGMAAKLFSGDEWVCDNGEMDSKLTGISQACRRM
jgi:hypothetical protein